MNGRAGVRSLRLVYVAVFFSSFDRMVITPLMLPIADDLGVSLDHVATIVTAYLVGYGAMQFAWGIVSDRLGRVRTLRVALVLALVGSVLTALAPDATVLLIGRLVAGGAFAAIVPGALIYVGDTVPIRTRHAAVTDVMTATAVGLSAATLLGGVLADAVGWRAAFAVPAVFVAALVVLLRTAEEPEPVTAATGPAVRPTVATSLATVLGSRWALLVLGLVFVEGMVLLGVLSYLPTTLQHGGTSSSVSGLVTAAYGLAILVFARLVKAMAGRWSAAALIATGAVMGIGGYTALVIDQGAVGVVIGSVLLAGVWAFMHSTMQRWATEVTPTARATMISLFATSLFLGSGVWTWLGSGFAVRGAYRDYFLIGLVVLVALSAVAVAARARYREER